MTAQPENTEPKISKDELTDKALEKVTGGDTSSTTTKTTPTVSEIHVSKDMDVASPKLF